MNTHSYAFLTLDTFTYKGHAKSVPMCTTGKEVDTFSSGSDPMFCLQRSDSLSLARHTSPDDTCDLTSSFVSQRFCRKTDSTVSKPACSIYVVHLVSSLQLLDVYAARLFGACSRQEGRRTVIFHPL